MANYIVEVSGADRTGKTTQAELLTYETQGRRIHNLGSFASYASRIPRFENPQDHFNWWFVDSCIDELSGALVEAYNDRYIAAEQSEAELAVVERGEAMLRSQIAALLAVRNGDDVVNSIDQANHIVGSRAYTGSQAEKTEVLLINTPNREAYKKKYENVIRSSNTEGGQFTLEQNELYSRYTDNLNRALGYVAHTTCIQYVGSSAVATQNTLRSGLSYVKLPRLFPQDPSFLGLAGLSESGKSAIAEELAASYGFTRLKIGYFNERNRQQSEGYGSPQKIALDIVHFLATNRHIEKATLESLHGPELSAELKMILGDMWNSAYIKLDDTERLRRLLLQFPDKEADVLIAEQREKDMTKLDAGVAKYISQADIVVDNSGSLEDSTRQIIESIGVKEMNNRSETSRPNILKMAERTLPLESEVETMPKRSRVLLFDQTGDKILTITRQKPGRELYTVFPGGGIEPEDTSAREAAYRELQEELGVDRSQVILVDNVLDVGEERFYLGCVRHELASLKIGGPEAARDEAVSGTYTPGWTSLSDMMQVNPQPVEAGEFVYGLIRKT